jgi:hypothetical protein
MELAAKFRRPLLRIQPQHSGTRARDDNDAAVKRKAEQLPVRVQSSSMGCNSNSSSSSTGKKVPQNGVGAAIVVTKKLHIVDRDGGRGLFLATAFYELFLDARRSVSFALVAQPYHLVCGQLLLGRY